MFMVETYFSHTNIQPGPTLSLLLQRNNAAASQLFAAFRDPPLSPTSQSYQNPSPENSQKFFGQNFHPTSFSSQFHGKIKFWRCV